MKLNYKLFILFILFLVFCEISFSQNVKTIKGHKGSVNSIQFFPDGLTFASGGADDDLFVWNFETLTKMFSIESDLSNINDIKILANGNYAITANSLPTILTSHNNVPIEKDRTIGIWDIKNRTQTYPIYIYEELPNIDVSPDGNYLFYAYKFGSVSYWGNNKSIDEKIKIYQFNINNKNMSEHVIEYYKGSYEYKPTGKEKDFIYTNPLFVKNFNNNTILVIGSYNDILFVDLEKNIIRNKLIEKISSINATCIDISPNKKFLAVANYSNDSWICIWDLVIGKSIKTLKGHEKDVLCVAFSPDGNYLASGSKDNTVRLWDLKTGKLIKILKGHENNINTLCFSNDGKVLLSGSSDETIKVWEVSDILPELKIYSLNYDLNIGIKIKLDNDYKKEYDETITSYYKPKGEYETTEDYNKRIETGKELETQLKEKYKQKFEELKNSKESELKSESNIKQEAENQNSIEIQDKINKSTKDTLVNITKISNYNADKQIFTITTKGYTVDVVIPVTDAPSFKENWQKAKVKCKKQLMNDLISWKYFDFVIIHPVSKVEYPASSK